MCTLKDHQEIVFAIVSAISIAPLIIIGLYAIFAGYL